MPKSKNLEKELQQHLRTLTVQKEWSTFVDVYLAMRERWKSKLIKISGQTMEQIALERVMFAARIEGCDLLFTEIERITEEKENAR